MLDVQSTGHLIPAQAVSIGEVAPPEPAINHGTRWGYNQGCRCEDCKQSNRDYRQAHRSSEFPTPPNVDRKCCLVCGVALGVHPFKACWRELR